MVTANAADAVEWGVVEAGASAVAGAGAGVSVAAGNAGDDSIVLSGALSTGSTVGGGAGSDTIHFAAADANFTGDSFFVKGGDGADSISVGTLVDGDVLGEFFLDMF
mgnify:CR=1 FL=1